MRVCLLHADVFGDIGSHYPVDVVDCCSTRIARKKMQTLKYGQARAAVRSNSGAPHERSSMPHAGTSFGETTMYKARNTLTCIDIISFVRGENR